MHVEPRHVGEHGFVAGNGHSIDLLDLAAVKRDCRVFACNAMVRVWPSMDYICAMDGHMVDEIWVIGNAEPWREFWVPPSRLNRTPGGWAHGYACMGHPHPMTGTFALYLATAMGCNPIWVAGHDRDGSNKFADTRGYKKAGQGVNDRNKEPARGAVAYIAKEAGLPLPTVYQIGPRKTISWMDHMETPPEWMRKTLPKSA